MSKLENLMEAAKISELLKKREEEKKECNVVLWALAVIGAIAAVAAIAYAVYRHCKPDYVEEFEDEFEDDFEDEDDIFEDEGEN